MMLEKVLLWTILLDLLGHSFLSGVNAYSTIFKFADLEWKESLLACRSGSRLPSISKIEGGQSYRLSDSSLQDYPTCFWLGAAYGAVDSVIGDTYPSECCETIGKTGNQVIAKYVACKGNGYYKYVCAKDENTVIRVQSSQEYRTWKDASSECASHNLQLPFKNNSGLLASLYDGEPPVWTRSALRLNVNLNLSPDQIPICFCKQQVQFFNCPQRLTTFCITETSTESSHANADFTTLSSASSSLSIFSSRSLNVNTTSANVQIRTSGKVHTTGFTDATGYSITSTNTTFTLLTTYVNMFDVPRKSTQETSIKDSNITDRETTTWPIVGGSIGSFVVFIVVVITIVIVLRRHRMKNGHDAVLKSTNNNTSPDKVPSQTNLLYDTVIGESPALEAPIATLPQASTAQEEESVVYAKPQKISNKSRNLMDNECNITQSTDDKEKHGLYSKVQKGQRTHGMSNKIIEIGGLGIECHNIAFVELENGEYLGNVYNKANFDVDQTSNVYDKANVCFEVLEIDNGNDYDKANFHHSEHSNYDTTYISNVTVDSTYDRLS